MDVPTGATKKQVKEMIAEQIKEWLQEHYEVSQLGPIGSTIRVTSIE